MPYWLLVRVCVCVSYRKPQPCPAWRKEGGSGLQLRQEDLVLLETTGGLRNKLITQDYLLLINIFFCSLINFGEMQDKKCPNMSVNKERTHAETHTARTEPEPSSVSV